MGGWVDGREKEDVAGQPLRTVDLWMGGRRRRTGTYLGEVVQGRLPQHARGLAHVLVIFLGVAPVRGVRQGHVDRVEEARPVPWYL